MDSLDEDRIRIEGQQASQLLSNPLFERYNERLLADVVESWANALDPDERERLWQRHAALTDYLSGLRDYLYTAKQLSEE